MESMNWWEAAPTSAPSLPSSSTTPTLSIAPITLWSDSNLFSHLLNACCLLPSPCSLRLGHQLHAIIAIVGAAFHRFTGNHLFHMYLKLGRVPAARAVFDAMACRNVMSFNILIGGLIHNGDINAAHKLFDEMPERNLATWNAMIAGLAHFELDEEGLECFLRSRREGLHPDEFGLGSTLRCCAGLKDAGCGHQIHAFVVINGFEQDMCVGSSLAHMYMRSGHLEEGERVLRGLPFLNVVSCHTVIAGRAQNGDPEGAFRHFILMKNVGLLPDFFNGEVNIQSLTPKAKIGGELMDYIIVLHGSKAVKTFCSRMHFSLGAGLSVAAGPIGRVLEEDLTAGDKGYELLVNIEDITAFYELESISANCLVAYM
ncbi:pentatricopeptide repeat-containing protein At2g41080-like [Zingiber officinale]|uniref:pentatricopeptide repeat-containing protein At2g41080-like n=1 Tax=Zingiber officinale TaxID=94328 RepID=UPI001C4C3710|nr:pentatricopeptide repeat-containing protein At2g41080-like [Zingiber officinale]